jgi:hypothetical protein
MPHESEQPLEQVEHAQHAAHDPFDRRVAVTMAIVAAILAVVALMSHRAHNETIVHRTDAANKWAYHQAKKGRQHLYEAMAELLEAIPADSQSNEAKKSPISKWRNDADRYRHDVAEIEEEARHLVEESELFHHRANYFDLGEFGVQLAIILCSVAVLTKRKWFWFSGIVFCIVGGSIAAIGLLLH